MWTQPGKSLIDEVTQKQWQLPSMHGIRACKKKVNWIWKGQGLWFSNAVPEKSKLKSIFKKRNYQLETPGKKKKIVLETLHFNDLYGVWETFTTPETRLSCCQLHPFKQSTVNVNSLASCIKLFWEALRLMTSCEFIKFWSLLQAGLENGAHGKRGN